MTFSSDIIQINLFVLLSCFCVFLPHYNCIAPIGTLAIFPCKLGLLRKITVQCYEYCSDVFKYALVYVLIECVFKGRFQRTHTQNYGQIARNPDFAACDQQRRRPDSASAQSDQCFCYSISGKYNN